MSAAPRNPAVYSCTEHEDGHIFVLGLRLLLIEASLIICWALANFLQSFFVKTKEPVSQEEVRDRLLARLVITISRPVTLLFSLVGKWMTTFSNSSPQAMVMPWLLWPESNRNAKQKGHHATAMCVATNLNYGIGTQIRGISGRIPFSLGMVHWGKSTIAQPFGMSAFGPVLLA